MIFEVRKPKREDNPRKGQAVWDESVITHPNGTIIRSDREDREVTVKFTDGRRQTYDWDELLGNWTDRLGGYWRLASSDPPDRTKPVVSTDQLCDNSNDGNGEGNVQGS